MVCLFTGISTSDTFRVEVVTNVEYEPTLTFGAWSPPEPSKITPNDLTDFLRSTRSNIEDVISGDLGRKLYGSYEIGRKMYEGMKLISAKY